MFFKKCLVEGHTMFSVECVFFKEKMDKTYEILKKVIPSILKYNKIE